MKARRGFLLLELMAVMVLLSALLLLVGQWWQHQQRLEQRQQWLAHTEYLLVAAEQFWLQQGRPPIDFTELQQTMKLEQLVLPWQQSWSLSHADGLLRFHIQAPSSQQAQWFGSQFQGAQVVAEQVTLIQWAPLTETHDDRYLYRVARPDRPELNQLATHLNMNQYDLTQIGSLMANYGRFDSVNTDRLISHSGTIQYLSTGTLEANRVTTPLGDLTQLLEEIEALHALWQQCRTAGGCQ